MQNRKSKLWHARANQIYDILCEIKKKKNISSCHSWIPSRDSSKSTVLQMMKKNIEAVFWLAAWMLLKQEGAHVEHRCRGRKTPKQTWHASQVNRCHHWTNCAFYRGVSMITKRLQLLVAHLLFVIKQFCMRAYFCKSLLSSCHTHFVGPMLPKDQIQKQCRGFVTSTFLGLHDWRVTNMKKKNTFPILWDI